MNLRLLISVFIVLVNEICTANTLVANSCATIAFTCCTDTVDLGRVNKSFDNETDISGIKTKNEFDVINASDRKYMPSLHSGKGYKILKKYNLRGKNVLDQSMFKEDNTIYHIQYDYDLNGKTIVIPEGCILKFEGGSLKNGTLYGNNTIISSLPYYIFKNIIFKGTYSVEESYAEWLGAKGDGTHNDTECLQKALDFFSTVKLCPNKNYYITNTLTFAFRRSLVGSNNTTISADGNFTLFKAGYNTFIKGFNISLKMPQTVVSITSEHIAKSYFDHDKTPDAWKYRQDADIKISDLRVISKSESLPEKKVSCFESIANGVGTGFWQVNVENIYVYGKYTFVIYLSNAKVNNAKSSTWQTDQVWKNIKIHQAQNAIYIGNKGDLSRKTGWSVGRILFDNVSMQYVKNVSEHFAILDECDYITFESCTPWDWPKASDEYLINPNKAKAVAILNAPLQAQTCNFRLVETPKAPNTVPYVTSATDSPIKSSYDIGYFKPDLSQRCTNEFIRSLPSGLYLIPSDSRFNTFFGFDQDSEANMGFGPNLLSLEHARNGMVLLTFYCTYVKTNQSIGYLIVPGDATGPIKDITFCSPKVMSYENLDQFKQASVNKRFFWGFVKDKQGSFNPVFKLSGHKFVDAMGNPFDESKAFHMGATSQRPKNVGAGFYYFDTTLNKPIWKKSDTGYEWVDATGKVL